MIDYSQVITIEMKSDEERVAMKARVAAERYKHETSGIVVNGVPISTERDSQALITGAALSSLIDPTYVCRWKTVDGFIELDSTTLLNISQKMRAYVQACFDRESELLAEINAGTQKEEMLTEGWPDGIYNDTQD